MAITFHHHQLPNGLTIIAEANPDAHSFAAGLFVNTGSRDESARINGVSHFLEHMMFKGSDKYSWEEVNRIFDEMGANYNAYTSQENTAYFASVLPEFTQRAVEHLSHLVRPAIRQKDFDTEKKVILEEIAMYLDDPSHRVYEAAMEAHFHNHPLARSVLGTAVSIKRLKRQEMLDYFNTQYGPDNTILSASGKLDFSQLVEMAKEYCGHWKPAHAQRAHPAPKYKPRFVHLADKKLNRHYVLGLAPGPSAQDPGRFAARVLADVIGDSDGSRLYWSLVDNAIAEEADFGFYPHDACGSFYLAIVTDPARAAKALEIAKKELRRVQTDLTEDEVERAKNKISTSIVLEGEVPLGRMRAIAGNWLYNKEYRSLEMDTKTLQSINADSLRKQMQEFQFEPMAIATLGPAKKSAKD